MATSGTVAAATSATVTLLAGEVVLLECAADATARIYAVSGVQGSAGRQMLAEHSGGRAIYGPFGAGDISIAAYVGTVTYQTGPATAVEIAAPSAVSGAGNPSPEAYQTIGQNNKLTIVNGRLYRGGQPFRHIGINAWDLLYDSLIAGTAYATDFATIASYGVKVVRVSAIPNVAADIVTYVGTTGSAPVSTYAPKVRGFLDEAARQGISVIFVLTWNEAVLLTALGGTAADMGVSTSTTRVWMRDFATWFSKTFNDHPGLGGWQIANEWVNYAWGNRFLTATSDLTKDHIGAMIECTDDIVGAIRKYDAARIILSAGGSLGNNTMGPWQSFADRYVASAGSCDAVSYHWYPDSWLTASLSHAFVGDDLGASDLLLPALRNACAAKGKVLMLDECSADYDSPANTVAKVHYQKFEEAGCDLLLDWGWYASAGGTPDLKTTRLACMAEIQTRNLSAAPSPTPLERVYPADLPAPSTAFRASTSANGWARFAQSASYQPSAGSPWAIMFWMREPSATAMAAGRRVIACNDGTGGFLITAYDQEASGIADHVRLQINCGGSLRNQASAYGKRRPGEWHHYAMAWDGIASGTSTFTCWFDGVPGVGGSVSSPGTPVTSANLLYIGAAADGSATNAVDVCDVIIVKGGAAILKSQQVTDYMTRGAVPANTVFRALLNGSVTDSVGGIAGTLGAAGSFVASGI